MSGQYLICKHARMSYTSLGSCFLRRTAKVMFSSLLVCLPICLLSHYGKIHGWIFPYQWRWSLRPMFTFSCPQRFLWVVWLCRVTASWASQYPKRRLSVRSRKVSKPRDRYFKLSYRFEIWQAHRQHCCRSACQISERSDNSKYKSRGFETWLSFLVLHLYVSSLFAIFGPRGSQNSQWSRQR